MNYLKCIWIHDSEDDPILLYSELDDNRMETRKIEIFRNGSNGMADANHSTNGTQLGIEPLPTIEVIESDPQFEPTDIPQQEFESVWNQKSSCVSNKA
ncbi:hypothetical protein OAF98_03640 [Planctomicrobium sp.]|jgi:hypothetical protein|nr:hypothetical protein [Planctomicrobium sp.]MDB4743556.1 hypothetical protein [Planctomicrobium sp.]